MTIYAACLTAAGSGAIAVIAVRGPAALDVVGGLFRPMPTSAEGPSDASQGRFYLGRFGEDIADEVVLSIRRLAPIPWLELHCHGGAEVVRLCLECLASRGVEVCTWRRLQQLTSDNPRQAIAAAQLAEASTVRTAAILLDQYHGAFAAALRTIVDSLGRGEHAAAGRLLDELIDWIPLGQHLVAPWRVVVAGAPNVGKSSLMNALAGYQRSVVAATPGTTRDVVTVLSAVAGWPVELADTAGLRTAASDLEGQGVERARAAAADADLCLWVLDGSEAPLWPGAEGREPLLVINKVDLPPAWDWQQASAGARVSARTGAGLAELCAALAERLVPRPPPAGSGVPITAADGTTLLKARGLLQNGDPDAARALLGALIERPG
jgi:tRNA modification GTPase